MSSDLAERSRNLDLVLLQMTAELNCNKNIRYNDSSKLPLLYMLGQNATVSLFAAHFVTERDITTAACTIALVTETAKMLQIVQHTAAIETSRRNNT